MWRLVHLGIAYVLVKELKGVFDPPPEARHTVRREEARALQEGRCHAAGDWAAHGRYWRDASFLDRSGLPRHGPSKQPRVVG
jgi:hypothetical protein